MSTYNIELVSLDKSFKSSSRLLRRRNAFSVDLDLSANKKATKNTRAAGSRTDFASTRSVTDQLILNLQRCPPSKSLISIKKKIHQTIAQKWKQIQKSCRKADKDLTGNVPISYFLQVIAKFFNQLSKSETSQLISMFVTNKDLISYYKFLQHFLLNLNPCNETIMERKLIHKSKVAVVVGEESSQFHNVMLKIRKRVFDNWKKIRKTFRSHDIQALGFVTPRVFRSVLRKHSIILSEEDFFNLMTYYDFDMLGQFPYNEFLRSFI